jgi:hypothetical protein
MQFLLRNVGLFYLFFNSEFQNITRADNPCTVRGLLFLSFTRHKVLNSLLHHRLNKAPGNLNKIFRDSFSSPEIHSKLKKTTRMPSFLDKSGLVRRSPLLSLLKWYRP